MGCPGVNSKGQLLVFELLSGLFGWVWIGGGIAKWLARGFLDNQKRVAFEADLVSKDMSSKEAGHAWVEAYARQGTSSVASGQLSDTSKVEENRRKAEERARIIADYGAFMARNPSGGGGQIWDVKCLPHDKDAILDAICLEIVRENDENRLEAFKMGALSLADYQDGVGDQPISMLGVDLTSEDPASLNDDDLRALAAKVADNPGRERFETYKPVVDKNLTEIQAKLLAAEQLRRDMPE